MTTSNQAQVAKLCKQYCKSLGIKARTCSSSFSGGDSVNVTVFNQSPEIMEKLDSEFSKYQYGHFDGMNDIYEHSNRQDDIPQTRYLFIDNEIDDSLYQEAWTLLKNSAANGDDKPEDYHQAKHLQWCDSGFDYHDQIEQYVRQILIGGRRNDYVSDLSEQFWNARKAPEPVSVGSTYIEEHTHTKKGFQMFIVVLGDRVDRDVFSSLLESARSLGGWYSRKWGTTPGGFAFKSRESAEQFISTIDSPDPDGPDKRKADKFRALAEKMQPSINDKFADRLTNTPKRMAQADAARREGRRLERTQQALLALADLHESGNVPDILSDITSKKEVYSLLGTEVIHNGYYCVIDTDNPSNTSPKAAALWDLLNHKSEEDKKKEELQRKINELQFSNIPGYFPTPDPVIDIMIDYADIQSDHDVLEPSAGSGAIADRIAPLCRSVHCIEYNYTLSEILEGKGYTTEQADFTGLNGFGLFDRVLMNPPFEKGQDMEHIRHAANYLKSGGVLVSVVSPGPFFRQDSKAQTFREWLDSVDHELIDLPDNSFKQSGTSVATKLLIVRKED